MGDTGRPNSNDGSLPSSPVAFAAPADKARRPVVEKIRKRRDVFTSGLILLCCFAGVFWLWSLAFPVCPPNGRLRANEAAAISCLRGYATAQTIFSLGKQAAVPGNTSPDLGGDAFADNFRNLCYGIAKGAEKELRLIGGGMADAYLVDNALEGAHTRAGGGAVESFPYMGYLFVEDLSGDLPKSEYGSRCALMAIPVNFPGTGRFVFWVDQEGSVYRQEPKAKKDVGADEVLRLYRNMPGSTPAKGPHPEWEKL